jgi:serine/threonine-protein kinase
MIDSQKIQRTVPRKFVPPSDGDVIEYDDIQYFIGEKIGHGAFGDVFDCRDEWGNELVAKVLLPRNQSYETIRENWLHEFQNLQQLRHPQITFIHQAFECQDTFYLIVEKCEFTLKDLVSNTSDSTDGELWLPYVSRDILNGLHYIHDHGYVHKDLHPGNVFVSLQRDPMLPDQEPVLRFKIGDLGISRLEEDIILSNTILAQWMLPPEALNPHEFGFIGKHVDIYHVGLLLLSLLLNQTPDFTRDEIIAGYPRELAKGLESIYAPAIARALRRHVSARTPSAIAMWREISEASNESA